MYTLASENLSSSLDINKLGVDVDLQIHLLFTIVQYIEQ